MVNKATRITRRKLAVRSRFPASGFRLSVSRSCKRLFAQVIDQKTKATLFGWLDKVILPKTPAPKSDRARDFGKLVGEEIKKNKIKSIVFDRGQYRYHGRVKAFAEGVRASGIEM